MELKIKVRLSSPIEIATMVENIRTIEKEYSCNCTLLEIVVD